MLLAAIRSAPLDPGPRRDYADWLESRDDPREAYPLAEDTLRRAPLGDPSRGVLGRAWREARAAQDAAWLAQVEPTPPVPPWLPADARTPPHQGLDDWFARAGQGHYQWVLLAVLAPIDAVSRGLLELRAGLTPEAALASGAWVRGVLVTREREYERIGPGVPVIQLRRHAWTVAMYCSFHFTTQAYHDAQSDALALSERLGTLAVEYSAEDTSGTMGYHLFECGEAIEYAQDAAGEGGFASQRRPPPWPSFPRDFPDEVFRPLGLHLPGFYDLPGAVRVEVPGPDAVARADVLDLRRPYRNIELPEMVEHDTRMMTGFDTIHRLADPEYEPYLGHQDGEAADGGDVPF
ncbi:hypothetical protein OJF2_76950 [Aquisphaera giovannonii]|uniref:Uncharacterized protein n=2 Tax=Aquisphaera giovannonii TaxID=406548 RepID=A0A5B9WF39_9BACT|nr:hypothetical protein OJF2_76950 [Aquisphaera giovannonii]